MVDDSPNESRSALREAFEDLEKSARELRSDGRGTALSPAGRRERE